MAVTNEYADGLFKRNWDNTQWVNFNDTNDCYRRNWDNTGWDAGSGDNGIFFRRNASNTGWVQIYPKGKIIVPDPPPIEAESVSLTNKQKAHSSWVDGYARQGYNTKDGGGGEQFGLISCNAKNIAGAGSIDSPGEVRFSGMLGSSGNYNRYQTISFRGTTLTGKVSNPFTTYDTHTPFTFSWKAGGPESYIEEALVNTNDTCILNWLNNINNYGNSLCMYNGEVGGDYGYLWSANYLRINNFSLKLRGYSYMSKLLRFDRPRMAPRMFSFAVGATPPKDEDYLQLVIPQNMNIETPEEAIRLLESEEIPYLSETDMVSFNDCPLNPVIFEVEDDIVRVSCIPNDSTTVQYENPENNMWYDSICVGACMYKIPENVKRVRIYDKHSGETFYKFERR